MKTHFYSIHCNNFLYNKLYDVLQTRRINVGIETKSNTVTLYTLLILSTVMDSFVQRDTIIINLNTSYADRIYRFLTTERQETIEPRTSTTLNHTHDVHGTNEPSPESHRSSTGRGVRTIGLIMKTSAVFFTRSSPRSRSSLGRSPSTFCLLLSPLRGAVSRVGRN